MSYVMQISFRGNFFGLGLESVEAQKVKSRPGTIGIGASLKMPRSWSRQPPAGWPFSTPGSRDLKFSTSPTVNGPFSRSFPSSKCQFRILHALSLFYRICVSSSHGWFFCKNTIGWKMGDSAPNIFTPRGCPSRSPSPLSWSYRTIVKGTVSRDFLLQIFFMNHLPPSPWK